MKIVCLGSTAQDTIDAANKRYALTSSTSQKIMDFFNASGGNTPLATTTIASKSEPGFFEKAWGIFDKLGTVASPTAQTVVRTAPGSPPILAMAGVSIVALILYKAVK